MRVRSRKAFRSCQILDLVRFLSCDAPMHVECTIAEGNEDTPSSIPHGLPDFVPVLPREPSLPLSESDKLLLLADSFLLR